MFVRGACLACLCFIFAVASAREWAAPEPAAAGLMPDRLERLDRLVEQSLANGETAGAVVLVQRRGQLAYLKAFGLANVNTRQPLQTDALFRIASMTKPVTSVAAMMLFEEGAFLLDDPVGRYLPSFDRDFEVARLGEDGELILRPAAGPVTIRHLMTHTAGLSYRFMGVQPLTDLYIEHGVSDTIAGETEPLADFVRRLAELPLAHDPGTAWTYGLNTDVLGRLVEVWSGQPLDQFLAERVFAPLGMVDTHFEVPAEKCERLASVHRVNADGALEVLRGGRIEEGPLIFTADYPCDGEPGLLSGGAGLTSTARDYARFLQMLLNGGELDGQRLLGRTTVELLSANQTAHLENVAFGAAGFTLAFGLAAGPTAGEVHSVGSLGWGGFFSTDFWIDPDRDLIGIMLTQHHPYGHRLMSTYPAVVYQALSD